MSGLQVARVLAVIAIAALAFLLGRLASPGFPRPLLVAGVVLVLGALLLPINVSYVPERFLRLALFVAGVVALAGAAATY